MYRYTGTIICDFCGKEGRSVTQSMAPPTKKDIRDNRNPTWRVYGNGDIACEQCNTKQRKTTPAIRHDPKNHGSS